MFTSSTNTAQTDRPARTAVMSDIHAINALREKLKKVRTGLVSNYLAMLLHDKSRSNNVPDEDDGNNGTGIIHFTVKDKYCLILIRSEIQTVDFYLAVAIEVCRRLVERLPGRGTSSHPQSRFGRGHMCRRRSSL